MEVVILSKEDVVCVLIEDVQVLVDSIKVKVLVLLGLGGFFSGLFVWLIVCLICILVEELQFVVEWIVVGELDWDVLYVEYCNEFGVLVWVVVVLQIGVWELEDQWWVKMQVVLVFVELQMVCLLEELVYCFFYCVVLLLKLWYVVIYFDEVGVLSFCLLVVFLLVDGLGGVDIDLGVELVEGLILWLIQCMQVCVGLLQIVVDEWLMVVWQFLLDVLIFLLVMNVEVFQCNVVIEGFLEVFCEQVEKFGCQVVELVVQKDVIVVIEQWYWVIIEFVFDGLLVLDV